MDLYIYLAILAASTVAAFFARRAGPSGKVALVCSLMPLLGFGLARTFC